MSIGHPSINRLIELFPDDRVRLVAAAERISRLSTACGCTEGAIAATIALALAAAYYVSPGWVPSVGHRGAVLWTVPFVIASAGIGKLIGILVARLRLILVYRRLHARYELRKRNVHVYEMGRSSGHRM